VKAPAIINAIAGGIKLKLVTSPQDMVTVPAIGKALEQRLYDAGIGTYWEIANMDSEALMEILRLTPAQKANLNVEELHKSALDLAQKTDMVGAIWNARQLDDLESITGISGVFEQRLYDAGISTFHDLANCSVEQLSGICRAPTTMMPNFGYWISRAQELASARDAAGMKPAQAAD
jgi:predicted flap endonuclease-1-like 5' DNA nuclease